jgi:hypothetical protein
LSRRVTVPRMARNYQPTVIAKVTPATVERLELIAPSIEGKRSAFIREAIERALDQAEAEEERSTV